MAELILTEAEQEAPLWSDLDDDALGKVVKRGMIGLKTLSEQEDKLALLAAGTLLCVYAARANADTLTQELDGVTMKGKPIGSWKITVEREA